MCLNVTTCRDVSVGSSWILSLLVLYVSIRVRENFKMLPQIVMFVGSWPLSLAILSVPLHLLIVYKFSITMRALNFSDL